MERKTIYCYLLISVCVFVVLTVGIAHLFTYYVNFNANPWPPGPKLVIDHDGGADDAMAIFLTLLNEKYFDGPKLVALTICHGNVNEAQVFMNSQRLLNIAGRRDIPIYRGSSDALVEAFPSDYYYGMDGLGDMKDVQFEPIPAQQEHAINALIDMSKKFEGELTLVAIGPLTNIAMAIKMDDQLLSRLAHLYVAAGNIFSEESLEPEFNAHLDVEAYHIVAANSLPDKVTFIPFSPLYAAHNISMDWRDNVLGAIDTNIMHNLNQFERISSAGSTTWTQLDPCALSMVLNEDLIQIRQCSNNSIVRCGDDRGININDFTDCDHSNVKLAYPAPEDHFKKFLYDVFSAEL